VVVQVALSLVLMVSAAMLVLTFRRIAAVPLGFDSDRVLVVQLDTVRTRTDDMSRPASIRRVLDAVAVLPNVAHAALSKWTPLGGGGALLGATVAGAPAEAERRVVANFITPGWFATYGTRLKRGRDFDARDSENAAPVVIVNEAFVRRFSLDEDTVGATVQFESATPGRTIVGVTADAVFRSDRMIPGEASLALRDRVPPTIFIPLAQSAGLTPPGSTVVQLSVRSDRQPPALLAPSVGAALGAIDPDLTFTFRPLSDYVEAAVAQERIVAMLSAFFGAAGVVLAALGIYGVTSYGVNLRRTEIGIRLALGAAPNRIVFLVLRRVGLLIGAGVVAGAIASLWSSRLLAAVLYEVDPRDGSIFVVAALALGAVGALAGGLPALRASRTDPATVLRSE
jgi:predicted permease